MEFNCSMDGKFLKHVLNQHICKRYKCLYCIASFESPEAFKVRHYNDRGVLICEARRLRWENLIRIRRFRRDQPRRRSMRLRQQRIDQWYNRYLCITTITTIKSVT